MGLQLFSGRGWKDDLFNEINVELLIPHLKETANKILHNIKDVPPEFSQAVDDNFWELI